MRIAIKACPQCVDDKAMIANRKQHTYTCRCCGRTWNDERIVKGAQVVFTGVARSTWTNDRENTEYIRPFGSTNF